MQSIDFNGIWLPSPAVVESRPHQVDIWRVALNLPVDSIERFSLSLSADETQRAGRFHFPAHRHRYILTHGALRDILARYLRCGPNQLRFSANPYGKPALLEQTLEFNLSHSADFALVAVSGAEQVGIDIEQIRQGISSHVIARQYFSKREVADLEQVPIEKRVAAFFTCWTRKEAYIKAQGLGLSLPLESFDVSLSPDEPAFLRATRPDAREAARWKLLSLDVDPHYAAAAAVENCRDLEFRFWDWNSQAHTTQ